MASEAIAGQEWSGSKMNAWAGNLVPALLHMPCSRLLVCKHCSCRPTFMDHSLVIFKGCPMGYHCHCRGLSDWMTIKIEPCIFNPLFTHDALGQHKFDPIHLSIYWSPFVYMQVNILPLLTNVALDQHIQFTCVWSCF